MTDPYNRIVHLPDWVHAHGPWRDTFDAGQIAHSDREVRVFAGLADGYVQTFTLVAKHTECNHCRSVWRVWYPPDFTPRPCDMGPCPKCDTWKTRAGTVLRWHDFDDAHLLNTAAYIAHLHAQKPFTGRRRTRLAHRVRRRRLRFTLAEMSYRGLVPTFDDMLVAWDMCCARGLDTVSDGEGASDCKPRGLLSIWAKVGLEIVAAKREAARAEAERALTVGRPAP